MEKKELAVKKQETVAMDTGMHLIQNALERGVDVQTMERLLEMRNRLKQEQAREAFFKSLSAFQSEIPVIPHTKKVLNKDGTIRYSYAAFEDIIRTITPYINKHGFSINFKTRFENEAVIVDCIITHEAGHSEVTSFRAPVQMSGRMLPIQEWGAALTFAKRYSLSLALGLATEEDTDAITTAPNNEEQKEVIAEIPATEAQLRAIHTILSKRGYDNDDAKHKYVSDMLNKEIHSFKHLSKSEASRIIDTLQKVPF